MFFETTRTGTRTVIHNMNRIDGRALAKTIRENLKKEITSRRLEPKLGVLLVGDDPASHLYVALKEKAAQETGVQTEIRRLPASTPDEELQRIIETWNRDTTIHGILIQVPLPAGHDTDAIVAAIDPNKDADGFHPQTLEKLYAGQGHILPPVHEGILRLIASTDTQINTANATIIAKSEIFSKPLEYLLRKAGAFVSILSPDDLDRQTLLKSHIIIVAVGRPKFIDRSLIPSGAVVIDVGTNRLPDGSVVGDVDSENVQHLDGWLTPVPGGVGPMTIATLLKNVVQLATSPSPLQASP